MSGVEILGIAAGVIQIAELGGKLSVKLFTFTRKIKNADRNIDSISQDIAATGAVLQQLGSELKKDEKVRLCSPEAIDTAKLLMEECHKVFKELNDAVDGKGKGLGSGAKVILGLKQRLKYPFLEPQIELLKANLEKLKSSLLVMLNVLIFAEQLKNQEALPILRDQRELLKSLVEEKIASQKQFDHVLKRLDQLAVDKDDPSNTTSASKEPVGSSNSSLGLVSMYSAAPQIPTRDDKESLLPSLPAHLHGRAEEIFDHCRLVNAVIEEINHARYNIDKGIRYRTEELVLDSHYNEWTHEIGSCTHHLTHVVSHDRYDFLAKCPELRRHWARKDAHQPAQPQAASAQQHSLAQQRAAQHQVRSQHAMRQEQQILMQQQQMPRQQAQMQMALPSQPITKPSPGVFGRQSQAFGQPYPAFGQPPPASGQLPPAFGQETQNPFISQPVMASQATSGANRALQDYQMQMMLLEQQNKKRLMLARWEQYDQSNVNLTPGGSPRQYLDEHDDKSSRKRRVPAASLSEAENNAGMNTTKRSRRRRPVHKADDSGIGHNDSVSAAAGASPTSSMIDGPMGPKPPMSENTEQGDAETTPLASRDITVAGQAPSATASSGPTHTQSYAYCPNPPIYRPKSPASGYSPASPAFSPTSPAFTPASPAYSSATPITHSASLLYSPATSPPRPNPRAVQAQQTTTSQQQMQPSDMQANSFQDFNDSQNFNLDFSTLDNTDVLENFDFDSFLNTSAEDAFNFVGSMAAGDYSLDGGGDSDGVGDPGSEAEPSSEIANLGTSEKVNPSKADSHSSPADTEKLVDLDIQCGVLSSDGQPCLRSLNCRAHPNTDKRAVSGRSQPYDRLLAAYLTPEIPIISASSSLSVPRNFTTTRPVAVGSSRARETTADKDTPREQDVDDEKGLIDYSDEELEQPQELKQEPEAEKDEKGDKEDKNTAKVIIERSESEERLATAMLELQHIQPTGKRKSFGFLDDNPTESSKVVFANTEQQTAPTSALDFPKTSYDQDGAQWVAFEVIADGIKLEYTIRCDVEAVDMDSLTYTFKMENAIYPRALWPREFYTGHRFAFETDSNQAGWALAELNPMLRRKRGLLRRALESWQAVKSDPRLRSRRVRRQSKRTSTPTTITPDDRPSKISMSFEGDVHGHSSFDGPEALEEPSGDNKHTSQKQSSNGSSATRPGDDTINESITEDDAEGEVVMAPRASTTKRSLLPSSIDLHMIPPPTPNSTTNPSNRRPKEQIATWPQSSALPPSASQETLRPANPHHNFSIDYDVKDFSQPFSHSFEQRDNVALGHAHEHDDAETRQTRDPYGSVTDVLPSVPIGGFKHTRSTDFNKSEEDGATTISASNTTPSRISVSGEVHQRPRRRTSNSYGRGFGSVDNVHIHPASFRNDIAAAKDTSTKAEKLGPDKDIEDSLMNLMAKYTLLGKEDLIRVEQDCGDAQIDSSIKRLLKPSENLWPRGDSYLSRAVDEVELFLPGAEG